MFVVKYNLVTNTFQNEARQFQAACADFRVVQHMNKLESRLPNRTYLADNFYLRIMCLC